MAENFLEEQLKRIRELSERMSRVREHAAEVSEEIRRGGTRIQRSPLQEVTDFREYPSPSSWAATSDSAPAGRRHYRSPRRSRK